MKRPYTLSVCMVLYRTPLHHVVRILKCLEKEDSFQKKIFLVDNSPQHNTKFLRHLKREDKYLWNPKNLGFSRANNQVIKHIISFSEFHLVINPDVYFQPLTIYRLANQLQQDPYIALIAPKIVYPDGKHQYSVRRYPTSLWELMNRRICIRKQKKSTGEYRDKDLEQPFYPEAIHGCFMLFKTNDFVNLCGFDPRYFLYMEDIDMCKKIDGMGKKKKYYPDVTVTHEYTKGSSKNTMLLFYHLRSAIQFFAKWRDHAATEQKE